MITKPRKVMNLPNEVLMPFMIERLESKPGMTATLPLRGRSMRPFLEDGRDKALFIAAKGAEIRVGDPVLALLSDTRYVMHRIVRIEGENVTLMGDGNLTYEYCTLQDIKAKAIGFFRKGRETLDSVEGRKWRLYSWLWTRLLPIRRFLLFLWHPHIPARWKKEEEK